MANSKSLERRLVVLRHAKSDWPAGVPDKDRPLAKRGRRDAAAAGVWLAGQLPTIDLVIHSDAERTTQTWSLVQRTWESSGGILGQVRPSPRVYEATSASLVEVLRAVPDDVRTVLLIGHNPGVQDLVVLLAGGSAGPGAALAAAKFPTCGLALLDITAPWSGLRPRDAALIEFVVPRG